MQKWNKSFFYNHLLQNQTNCMLVHEEISLQLKIYVYLYLAIIIEDTK